MACRHPLFTLFPRLFKYDTLNSDDLSVDITLYLPRNPQVVLISGLEVSLLGHSHLNNQVKKFSCCHAISSLVMTY